MFSKKQARIFELEDENRCLQAAVTLVNRLLQDEQEAHAHAINKVHDLSVLLEEGVGHVNNLIALATERGEMIHALEKENADLRGQVTIIALREMLLETGEPRAE